MSEQEAAPNTNIPEQKSMTDSLMDFDPLRALFGLDNVEALRKKQRAAHDEALKRAKDAQYSPEMSAYYAGAAVADQVSVYVDSGGFSPDDPQRKKIVDGLMGVSILEVPESEWAEKPDSTKGPMGDQSGRDKTIATFEAITGESYTKTHREAYPVSEEDQSELAVMHEELDGLRENLATLSAKRQGRIFGKGGEAYDEALSAYHTHLIALGELENEQLLHDESVDEETKKAKVVSYLFDEQTKLRESTKEKLENTKVGKIVNWLTTGSRSQRILKGIAVGAGAAVVAGAVAAGAGVIGVAGAAAIGAGIGVGLRSGVKFVRGFAVADAKAGRGMDTNADGVKVLEQMKESTDDNEPDYVQRVANLFHQQFEEDTRKEQLKRRKSVAKGLGAVALGAVVGTTAGIVISEIATGGIDFNPFSGHFGNHPSHASNFHDDAHNQGGHDQSVDNHDEQRQWHEQQLAQQQAAQEAAERAAEQANQPDPNFYVHPGEGGIELFNHMGLSQDQWYQIKDQLMANYGVGHSANPDFYQTPSGDVRLAHPGQLSIEAQKYIKSAFGMG